MVGSGDGGIVAEYNVSVKGGGEAGLRGSHVMADDMGSGHVTADGMDSGQVIADDMGSGHVTADGAVHGGTGQVGGGEQTLRAAHGENLLRLLRRYGVNFVAPCGGNARCGKCIVRVETDLYARQPATAAELALLSQDLYSRGYRLACFLEVTQDLIISLTPASAASAKIITSGLRHAPALDPFVRKYPIVIKKQTLSDQAPDAEHILKNIAAQHPQFRSGGASPAEAHDPGAPGYSAAANADGYALPYITPYAYTDVGVLRGISAAIACPPAGGDGVRVTCVCAGRRIAAVEPGDTSARCFGAALDIGTTTIAGYLFNLSDGAPAAVASALNPQALYGADVISRINYASSAAGGARTLRDCVTGELNRVINTLAAQAGAKPDEIYAAYVTGNTTMLHLFLGLPPQKISVAPFIPVTTGLCAIPQGSSGLCISDTGLVVCLPGVSAYVGADTLTAALACDMDLTKMNEILIDIGTNGEIALCGAQCFYTCSTAAGPAFEGANISCGVGGVTGAIDSVLISMDCTLSDCAMPDGAVSYTTIDGAAAIGLCGSGLVDLVAQLLRCGAIDETGRLAGAGEAEAAGLPPGICKRLVAAGDGGRAFQLIKPGESAACENGVLITQRDIRELQNAKAAIAAGVLTLLSSAGLGVEDIDRVYLAGGFGNYISVQSALDIGLLPGVSKDRVIQAGNSAGAGACAALLSDAATARLVQMSRKARYIELSSSPVFTQNYVECMSFE